MNYLLHYSRGIRINLQTTIKPQKHFYLIIQQSFSPIIFPYEDESNANERIVVKEEEFFITEAFFHDLESDPPDEGGAICSTIDNAKLCIEKTTFDNCKSPTKEEQFLWIVTPLILHSICLLYAVNTVNAMMQIL